MPELLVRSADRFVTHGDGIVTHHVFSFGSHYDPERIGFGPVSAVNTEIVGPGAGYDLHHHRGVDIVTVVVSGSLDHDDSLAGSRVLGPGSMQLVRAGSGVSHAERNASREESLEFLQLVFRGDAADAPEPPQSAERLPLRGDGWVQLVGPEALPSAPNGYAVLCVSGAVRVGSYELSAGDSLFSTQALDGVVTLAPGVTIAAGFATNGCCA